MAENGAKLKLSAPWYTYQRQLEALFAKDEDIEVGQLYDLEEGPELWIYIDTEKKYEAFDVLFPKYVEFGNVKLKLVLKYRGPHEAEDLSQRVKDLFEGNERVKEIVDIKDGFGSSHTFVCFKPEVIQFFNDDTSDLYGKWSGLAQDIARDVIEADAGVHFTTASVEEDTCQCKSKVNKLL